MSHRSIRGLMPVAVLLCLLMLRCAPAQTPGEARVIARARATNVSVTVLDHTADGQTIRDGRGERARARQAEFVDAEVVLFDNNEVAITRNNQTLLRARAFGIPEGTYYVISSYDRRQLVNGTLHRNANNMREGFSRLFLTNTADDGSATTTILEFVLVFA